MSDEKEPPGQHRSPPRRPPAGLCDSCAHQRIIGNTRGSSFSMCDRSRTEAAYPRYPRLPVLACSGHELRPANTEAPEGPR